MATTGNVNGNGKGAAAMVAGTSDLEEALSRVAGVRGARVVIDTGGRITEIHVLAAGERNAKQIARDVKSTVLAGFGLDVDHRAVSVAQLDATAPEGPVVPAPQPAGAARPVVESVAASSRGATTEIVLEIRHGDRSYAGSARGPAKLALTLTAEAALDAVRDFLDDLVVEVRSAQIIAAQSGDQAVLVILRTSTERGGEALLCGSALIRKDPSDAVVRATFSALNRALRTSPRNGTATC